MKPFGPFTLAASTTQDEDLDLAPIVDMLVVKNASPFILTVQPYQGSQVKIPPYWADLVPVSDFQGKLTFSTDAGLAASNAPISVALVDAYARGERVLGTYPVPLSYLFNLGNSVPLSASATSVDNEGNAAPTAVVTGQATGATAPGLLLYNDGSGNLASGFITFNAAGQEIFNKLLAGSNQTYIGFTPADGAAWGIGQLAADHGIYFAMGSVQFEIHPSKGIKPRNEGFFISGFSEFAGTITGTYAHNLGATPDGVLPMQNSVGSQTMGFDSLTSTTVHITCGAGNPFTALVFQLNS